MDLSILTPTQLRFRVAILVDGDNFPRSDVERVESMARKLGEVTIRRVFGDMAQHKDWAQDINYTANHSPTSSGKNRADMMLVVAAMDLAHRGLASAFLIVSDDRDFAPLVNHLREQGHRVEWTGKSPGAATAKPKVSANPATARKVGFVDKVKRLVGEAGKDGLAIHLLGPAGQKEGIKISETPQKTWRAWLIAHASEFDCDPRGPNARVRLRDQPPAP